MLDSTKIVSAFSIITHPTQTLHVNVYGYKAQIAVTVKRQSNGGTSNSTNLTFFFSDSLYTQLPLYKYM
jgi:hypothetical protein